MGRKTAEAVLEPTFQPESVSLYVRSGSRDAVYHMQLTHSEAGWNVRGQYGRRGSTLSGTEIATNVSYEAAKKAFDKKLKSKLTENPPYRYMDAAPEDHANEPDDADESNRMASDGDDPQDWEYEVTNGDTKLSYPEWLEHKREAESHSPKPPTSVSLPISSEVQFSCELLMRVEPAQALAYAKRDRFWFQPKRDDRRLVAVLRNGEIFGFNKKGERIAIDESLRAGIARIAKAGKFTSLMFDGEIETTGFWMWDLLDLNGEQIRDQPYRERYEMLDAMVAEFPPDLRSLFHVVPTAMTTVEKLQLWQHLESVRAEGFVIKDSEARYRPGRTGQHLKCKFEQTGSVIVGPKPRNKVNDGHRSVAMYCYAGERPLRFMGSVGVPDKYELPKDGDIIEVRYLYRHHGIEGKLIQAKFFGKVRNDVRREDCIPEQFRLKQTAEEAAA